MKIVSKKDETISSEVKSFDVWDKIMNTIEIGKVYNFYMYGDMVVMSYEEYQSIQYEMGVTRELRAAELESETTIERYTHDDVMAGIRAKLKAVQNV